MSRIGKMPVVVPSGVQVSVSGAKVKAKGPLGELEETLPSMIKAELKDGVVHLSADYAAAKNVSALHGMARARVNNLVKGVSTGFSRVLEIVGLGFRAEVAGSKITMSLGKSHPVIFEAPAGVKIAVDPKKTVLTLSCASRELLGETVARIRELRPPEPYKGTGIRYQGEHIRRKAGKTAAGAGAGAGGKK